MNRGQTGVSTFSYPVFKHMHDGTCGDKSTVGVWNEIHITTGEIQDGSEVSAARLHESRQQGKKRRGLNDFDFD